MLRTRQISKLSLALAKRFSDFERLRNALHFGRYRSGELNVSFLPKTNARRKDYAAAADPVRIAVRVESVTVNFSAFALLNDCQRHPH